jgi:predicted metal-dependent hydrolase
MNEKEKIERIKELVEKNPDTKITTSGLRVNIPDIKNENEVRELVEKSEELVREKDSIKLAEN